MSEYDFDLNQEKEKFELVNFGEEINPEFYVVRENLWFEDLDYYLRIISKKAFLASAKISLVCIRETSSISSDILNRFSKTSDYLITKIKDYDDCI